GSIPSPISLPSAKPDQSEFVQTKKESDALARHASVFNWNEASARSLLDGFASESPTFRRKEAADNVLGQRAKRLVLALDRLVIALNRNCSGCIKAEPEITKLFQDVKTLDGFDPLAFADHLDALRDAVRANK